MRLTDGETDDESSCECPCQCLQDSDQEKFCPSRKNPLISGKPANPGKNPVKQVEPVCPPEVQRIDSIDAGVNHLIISFFDFSLRHLILFLFYFTNINVDKNIVVLYYLASTSIQFLLF